MTNIDLVPNRKYYYTQLNNVDDPKNACFATTIAAGLDVVLNHDMSKLKQFAKNKGLSLTQSEDIIRWYLKNDKDTQRLYKRSHPNTSIPVVEWADCMVYGVNKLIKELYNIKKDVIYYDGSITLKKIRSDLSNKLPIACSLKFLEYKITGHYVLIVGCNFIEDILNKLIINDPYKDWLHNTSDGYHVKYLLDDWINHSKGYGIRFNEVIK